MRTPPALRVALVTVALLALGGDGFPGQTTKPSPGPLAPFGVTEAAVRAQLLD